MPDIGLSLQLAELQSGFRDAVAVTNAATRQMGSAFVSLKNQSASASRQLFQSWTQASLDWSRQSDGVFTHFDRAFRNSIGRAVRGTQSLSQAWARMGADMVTGLAVSMERMVSQFIAGELKMLIFHQTMKGAHVAVSAQAEARESSISFAGTLKEITRQAAKAAAKAYAWGAGIGGPPLGAIMAAVAFAGVEALGALTSAKGGWDQVPEDQLALVHKNEMILPAYLAGGIRSLFSPPAYSYPETRSPQESSNISMPAMHITVNAAADPETTANRVAALVLARIKRYAKDWGN